MRLFPLVILFLAFSCSKPKYSGITIEYNCLFKPCPLIKIENDTVYWIDQFSNKVLFEDKINLNRISKVMDNLKLDTLSSTYINNYADDGIQLNIILRTENKEKIIYISNYYISGIDSIIKDINQSFPDSLKLKYPKDMLMKLTKEGLDNNLIEIKK